MDEEIKNVQNEDGINEETAEETTANAEVEEEPIGNIKISVDVVSTIAGIATTEIDGVAGMYGTFAGGIAEMFGAKKNPSKGVKVDMNETTATIDLYIVVDYGVRIPELSWEIQENVKNSVETMTGLDVQKVNIHIEGVSFEKEKEEKIELDSNVNETPLQTLMKILWTMRIFKTEKINQGLCLIGISLDFFMLLWYSFNIEFK